MASPVLQFKRGALANLPGLRAGEPALTTDSFDLYVGIDSTTTNNKFFGSHRYWTRGTATTGSGVNLVEGTNNGTDYITIKSPNSLAGIVTYTLPGTQGGANSVLTNDGTGTLTWGSGSNNATFTGVSTFQGPVQLQSFLTASGISTFSSTTDNTLGTTNTGAVQIAGGVAVAKNLTVGAGLSVVGNVTVAGVSTFVGNVTFQGGTINLGDANTDDINVAGEFVSNLVPNTDNTYDLGSGAQRWRNANFAGVGTFASGVKANNVQIGTNGANTVDTSTGNLTLNSASGTTVIDDYLVVQNNAQIDGSLNVNGNVTIGGTSIVFTASDVRIRDKDIVLGFTTNTSGQEVSSDTTANHGGVAIASTEGTPLVSFSVVGINTLADTYKQMMWFKSGTLGFSTDVFAFNYGVAIGTTTVANGIRLAVGSGVTISDTAIRATTFYGAATRANTVDTTTTTTNSFFAVPFVTNFTGTNGETLRVGIGVSVNPSTGNVKSSGDLLTGSGYLSSPGGTRAMYLFDTTGDVSFQGKVVSNSYRSGSNSSNTLSFVDLDASFARNLTVAGVTTVAVLSASSLNSTTLNVTGFSTVGSISVANLSIAGVTTGINATGISTLGTVHTGTIKAADGTSAITITNSTGTVQTNSDLTVGGNLYINGSTTQVNTSQITVEDRTIELGIVDGAAPSTTTTWDLGVLFNYNDGAAKKSALIWEQGDARFKLGSVITDGGGTGTTNPQITFTTYAALELGEIWMNNSCTGGSSRIVGCTGGTLILENITIDAGSF